MLEKKKVKSVKKGKLTKRTPDYSTETCKDRKAWKAIFPNWKNTTLSPEYYTQQNG